MTWSLRVDPERTPAVRADNVTRVRTLTSLFRQYHLGGIKEKRTAGRALGGDFPRPRLHQGAPAGADFRRGSGIAHGAGQCELARSSRKQVPWERIDDALFDRIARFVVREDDSLFS
ncbi:MAG: hypothetical protein IPK27_07020 [Rhodanobacteraceae bacterium]|nr:hypothetical protein [Rhodanobacteraceae bacterium]